MQYYGIDYTRHVSVRMGGEKDCHNQEVDSAGGTFFLLVIENYGLWSDDSLRSLTLIASKTTSRSTLSLSVAFSNLMQQLSVRLYGYGSIMLEWFVVI